MIYWVLVFTVSYSGIIFPSVSGHYKTYDECVVAAETADLNPFILAVQCQERIDNAR